MARFSATSLAAAAAAAAAGAAAVEAPLNAWAPTAGPASVSACPDMPPLPNPLYLTLDTWSGKRSMEVSDESNATVARLEPPGFLSANQLVLNDPNGRQVARLEAPSWPWESTAVFYDCEGHRHAEVRTTSGGGWGALLPWSSADTESEVHDAFDDLVGRITYKASGQVTLRNKEGVLLADISMEGGDNSMFDQKFLDKGLMLGMTHAKVISEPALLYDKSCLSHPAVLALILAQVLNGPAFLGLGLSPGVAFVVRLSLLVLIVVLCACCCVGGFAHYCCGIDEASSRSVEMKPLIDADKEKAPPQRSGGFFCCGTSKAPPTGGVKPV
eukprot:TRINITY_DN66038_c0_g1_i1.p1 TRINITY_DN66038_c0_g1~~TRINITY_DN66038_c0_g1_i1.p1  ORF type:complete len:353 (+),score=68.35 TRINITY_DN66038_c0_g1_i1:76-1059(+)